MRVTNFSFLFVLLATACGIAPVLAQHVADEGACDADLAKLLVQQVVAESRTVAETDKRIKMLIRSAEFLWRSDPQTARDHLAEAYKVASDRFKEKGFEKKDRDGSMALVPDHRFEVIRAIAPKDPEWARRLIDELLKEAEKAAADRASADRLNEVQSIMSVALDSIETNPELSRYLFRRLMMKPLGHEWLYALYSIAGKDRRFADQLYSDLLRNYANETPRRFLFLSSYPFGGERILGIDKYMYGGSSDSPGLFANRELQMQFILAFFRRITLYAADPANHARPPEQYFRSEPIYMVSALRDLEPIVVERFPPLLQQFAEARARANAMLNDEMRKQLSDDTERTDQLAASLEDRLAEVEQADKEGRLTDRMVVQLVTWSTTDKTEEQFKRILPWLDKIEDRSTREATENYYWFLRSKLAVKEERFDDAEKFAAKVPTIEHRALLMFDTAKAKLKNISIAAEARQILGDVGRLARQADDSVSKARVLLGLVSVYEDMDHILAMEELSDAVKMINKLDDPDLLSDVVHQQIKGKDFAFYAVYTMPGYDLESTFKLVSKKDFSLSLSNARALNDKYFRTLAVLAVAQNCIDKPKPRGRTAVRQGLP